MEFICTKSPHVTYSNNISTIYIFSSQNNICWSEMCSQDQVNILKLQIEDRLDRRGCTKDSHDTEKNYFFIFFTLMRFPIYMKVQSHMGCMSMKHDANLLI
jgi:hypothetical protein